MKSDRKWNFAAQTGLVLIIALAVLAIYFAMVYIAPKVEKEHDDLGEVIPNYLQAVIDVSQHAWGHWYLYLIALAGAGGLFEWRCKSENKALIRTAILVGMSLVSVVGALWVAVVTMVSLALLFP